MYYFPEGGIAFVGVFFISDGQRAQCVSRTYAIMQSFMQGAKCAHFLNFMAECGSFAYTAFLGKMFLTFPFGERIL